MSTVVKPRSSLGSDRTRLITITAVDAEGVPAAGAEIVIFVSDSYAGVFTLDADRSSASLELTDSSASIRLVAEFGGHTLSADIGPNGRTHQFRFPVALRSLTRAIAPAEARCPDGMTGRPCVECAVGGTHVRICVA